MRLELIIVSQSVIAVYEILYTVCYVLYSTTIVANRGVDATTKTEDAEGNIKTAMKYLGMCNTA